MTDILLIILAVLLVATWIQSFSAIRLIRSLHELARKIDAGLQAQAGNQERLERLISEEAARGRQEASAAAQASREELGRTLKNMNDSLLNGMTKNAEAQYRQLDAFSRQLQFLTESNTQSLDKMRETVEGRLKSLQDDNAAKLEKMRATVDEKLHETLEKRLGESFNVVSERLELVHKGLGEMQALASGVGDLKKVLTNVKTRGTWGEIQLGNLLEQILTLEQYAANVCTRRGSSERVEFAIRLPGNKTSDGEVWIPMDAKFPQESYQRLLEAQEKADSEAASAAARELEARIKGEARDIRDKYLDPPHTTDFGIMFLPSEGLYAEVLRRPGLCEQLQREFRVVIAGPTTLTALLNSLQMGFRTLAIEKRSSEVWTLLGAVKTEFGKFGDILDKTQDKLSQASKAIEEGAKRSRAIERKLRTVQELPAPEARAVIGEAEEAEVKSIESVPSGGNGEPGSDDLAAKPS
ncbi:MAG: DNA recombination protein RmuC [Candidatus Zixiibacteriota bacterium]|nr:MAG: DNA recombination protein RmuC [candidate division Zixibacteria bacterium]